MVETMTAVHQYQSDGQFIDDEFIDESLQRTNRTFALAIPLQAAQRRWQLKRGAAFVRVDTEDCPVVANNIQEDLIAVLTTMRATPLNLRASWTTSIAATAESTLTPAEFRQLLPQP